MKTEIIKKEKPKAFEPFTVKIEVESISDLNDITRAIGTMSNKGTLNLYIELQDYLRNTI